MRGSRPPAGSRANLAVAHPSPTAVAASLSRLGRQAIWTRNEPVSILGAWCIAAYDVVGEAAFTAGLEHTSAAVGGRPRTYTLRATQVYRREDGEWRVAHRHADTVTEQPVLWDAQVSGTEPESEVPDAVLREDRRARSCSIVRVMDVTETTG